mmetsp:Transcript_7258/g.21419  ORF Transcript_7258/g.21419 Transcript_7258/m.21419 type:complete len:149 (+) Transcript_7258:143-589(+)
MLLSRAARLLQRARPRSPAPAAYSNSITYSGGQASSGQGGFYGSGGSRVLKTPCKWEDKAVASVEAVQELEAVMKEAYALADDIDAGDPLTDAVIEAKAPFCVVTWLPRRASRNAFFSRGVAIPRRKSGDSRWQRPLDARPGRADTYS